MKSPGLTDSKVSTDTSLQNIPEGWVEAKIGDVVQPVPNARPQDEPDRDFGYVDISSIDNETFRITHTKRFLGRDAPSRAKRPIRAGDVLFSNVRTYLRNIAVVPVGCDADLCSTGFTVLRSNGAVDPIFLFRYLLTDDFIDRITQTQTGSHYPATSDAVVLEQTILIPPLSEQSRIVAQTDRLLDGLARARHRLTNVSAIVRNLRQSVLVAACSGRLTEDWREGRSQIGPAWSSPATLPDSAAINGPHDLPESWRRANAGEFYHDARYGTSVACERDDRHGYPVLRIPNIAKGRVDLADLKYGLLSDREVEALCVREGDILVCRTNGSLDLIGKAAVMPSLSTAYAFASYLILLRLRPHGLLPAYFHICLTGPVGRTQIEMLARSTAGQYNLNLQILRNIRVPVPPIEEQEVIVRRVETLIALTDLVEGKVAAASVRAARLTEAILARAFRGELVPSEAALALRDGREYDPACKFPDQIRE